MLGRLSISEISQVLNRQSVGRLGCYAEGKVYIVPIAFAYDGEYIYGHSPEGLKIQMMRKNPMVCFEVDSVEDLANWQCIVIQGEFQELMGRPAREAMDFFMKRFRSHYLGETAAPSDGIAQFHEKEHSTVKSVIFRIRINEKSGRFERQH